MTEKEKNTIINAALKKIDSETSSSAAKFKEWALEFKKRIHGTLFEEAMLKGKNIDLLKDK